MINYNSKNWLTVFRFHKSDTIRSLLPMLVFFILYSWGIVSAEQHLPKVAANLHLRNINVMHTLLGFAISMLLVFRTNTAYDRWWEGRKLWGALMNNSRNLAMKLNSFLPYDDTKNRSFFKRIIPLFAVELNNHLQTESTRLQLDEKPHPEIPNFDTSKHVPNQVACLLMSRVNLLYRDGKLTGDQLILLNGELQSFLDICGGCERIKNTPIPFSYSAFIKKFIVIYVITLPLGFAYNLGHFAIPVTTFIFYVLASLELIAEEIEDPFGTDTNDLPMQKMTANIKKNVEEILA